MTAKLFFLSKDIIRVIDEYLDDEINFQDLLNWVKNHPCFNNNYCTKQENKMIADFYGIVGQKKFNKQNLRKFNQKIQQRYFKEKYSEFT